MNTEKDVLDGWCVYVEKVSGNASNSSDSESIEIISEDEAGNYQIYSKNYFHPDSTVDYEIATVNNEENIQRASNIKEYSENDPTHLLVEEGKEAQEKDAVEEDLHASFNDKKTFNFLLPENNSCDNDVKTPPFVQIKNISCSEKGERDFKELENGSIDSEKYRQETPENLKDENCNRNQQTGKSSIKLSFQSSENIPDNVPNVENEIPSAIEINSDSFISNNQNNEIINNVRIVKSVETKAKAKEPIKTDVQETKKMKKEEAGTSSQTATTNTNKETTFSNRKLLLKHKRKGNDRALQEPCTSSTTEMEVPIESPLPREPEASAVCKPTSVKTARNNNQMIFRDDPPIICDFPPACYKRPRKRDLFEDAAKVSTEYLKSYETTSVRKARKRHISGKKFNKCDNAGACNSSSSGHEIEESLLRNTNVNKSNETPDSRSDPTPDAMPVQLGSTRSVRSESDISTLALITIVGSIIYILYSVLNLSNSTPVLPQTEKASIGKSLTAIHHRYAQLVTDWEVKVLENAELDFKIALREKSAELSRVSRQNISHLLPSRVTIPDCMARHLLTHMFGYLRQFPPDIADLTSGAKSKFCVDLSLLLTPLRVASYSDVLKLLSFLASPSSELDYQAVFDHYLAQQRIHIHDIIERDYPEIYRANSRQRPHGNLPPCMYCVSMQRFSVLKNRYASGQDNMAALLTLSELYVQNDVCLQAMVKIDGRSIDILYEIALDVLLSQSVSTAITLDPSLLHDYYLELILSNEDNLKKLSRLLFKYNILAIQKFDLTVKEQPFVRTKQKGKHRARKYIKKVGNDDLRAEEIKKEKFTLVRDGDDEFLVLNRKFEEDSIQLEKEVNLKFTSFGKGDVELFYDSQLREISKGYSSKVKKFLSDINKDLKHALCYPYVNDPGMTAPVSERNESLVRFIRNMCRTNVLNNQVKSVKESAQVEHEVSIEVDPVDALKETPNVEDEFSAKFVENEAQTRGDINNYRLVDLPSNLAHAVDSMHFEISGKNLNAEDIQEHSDRRRDNILTSTSFEDVERKTETVENKFEISYGDRDFIKIEGDDTVEIDDVEFFGDHVLPRGNNIKYSRKFIDPDRYIVPTENMGSSQDKILLDPDSHIYRRDEPKDRVLLNPDSHFERKERVFLNPDNHFEREEKVFLNPDNHFENISQDEKTADEPDEVVQGEESPKSDLNDKMLDLWLLNKMANSFGLNHAENDMEDPLPDLNSYVYQNTESGKSEGYTQRTDGFRRDYHREKLNKYDRREHGKREKDDWGSNDRVNAYDTIRLQKRFRSNSHDKENIRPDHHGDGRNTRVNAYDNRPKRFDKEYFYHSSNRPNREERIVHIDGSENKYTRHVYIDNVARDDRWSKSKDGEMDWWLNRRARLRAKLRKNHDYPAQDNPEYQYDYLYS